MIRQGATEDLQTLVEGNLHMAQETEGLALDRATVTRGVAAVLEGQVPGRYFVFEVDGRVQGQLMVTFEWSDWRARQVWWIQSVYVWPEARRGGVYRQLYHAVQAAARADGAGGIRLYVDERNTRAQEVYARLGMNGEHYRVFEAMFEEPAS